MMAHDSLEIRLRVCARDDRGGGHDRGYAARCPGRAGHDTCLCRRRRHAADRRRERNVQRGRTPLIVWSVQGPAGPAGPAAATGATGAEGPQGPAGRDGRDAATPPAPTPTVIAA